MYETHFGLTKKPFSSLPDPAFLYKSPEHTRALAILEHAVLRDAGVTVLTGDTGCGKTTLIRHLINNQPSGTNIGLVSLLRPDSDILLPWILYAFGLDYEVGGEVAQYDLLLNHLVDSYQEGKRSVLIVDEVHAMQDASLEEIRMISNLNVDDHPLISIILVGHSQLHQRLTSPSLSMLYQRVAAHCHLGPMSMPECGRYINSRMRTAGGNSAIFTAEAVDLIAQASKGVPRVINAICETSLLRAYTRGITVIDRDVVEVAVPYQTDQDTPPQPSTARPTPVLVPAANADDAPTPIKPKLSVTPTPIETNIASVASIDSGKAVSAKAEAARIIAAKVEADRLAAAKAEADKIEAEKIEAQRIKEDEAKKKTQEIEAARVEAEKIEAERIEAEKAEEKRIETERIEAAKAAAAKAEAERIEAEKAEAARIKAEKIEAAKAAAAKAEAERIEAEQAEAARLEAEKIEAAKAAAAKAEAERVAKAKAAAAKAEAERIEAEKAAAAKAKVEEIEAAKVKAARIEAENIEAAKAAAAKAEAEKIEAARIEDEKIEAARVEAERLEAERIEARRFEASKAEIVTTEAAEKLRARVRGATKPAAAEILVREPVRESLQKWAPIESDADADTPANPDWPSVADASTDNNEPSTLIRHSPPTTPPATPPTIAPTNTITTSAPATAYEQDNRVAEVSLPMDRTDTAAVAQDEPQDYGHHDEQRVQLKLLLDNRYGRDAVMTVIQGLADNGFRVLNHKTQFKERKRQLTLKVLVNWFGDSTQIAPIVRDIPAIQSVLDIRFAQSHTPTNADDDALSANEGTQPATNRATGNATGNPQSQRQSLFGPEPF